ncbi:MAG: tripartite tricarboxylate transporter substrate binding protein, partial [Microvirga sp.]
MTITRRRTLGLLAGAALAPAGALAQSFPIRTIRIVVPYPAGGPVDALARLLTPELGALGQNAIVENIGGGAGAIGARQ